jgi:hypothetical protein
MRILAFVVLPALLFSAAAGVAGAHRGLAVAELARGMPGPFLLLVIGFSLARPGIAEHLRSWTASGAHRRWLAAQALLVPYLVYGGLLGQLSLTALAAQIAYVNLPLLILSRLGPPPPRGRDALALLLVWLPVEFRLLPPAWTWPEGQSGHLLDGLLGACLAVYLFGILRGLEGIGFTSTIRARDVGVGIATFAAFLPAGIAIGLATGFFRFVPRSPDSLAAAGIFLGIFLSTGIPEELLFRGLIQNGLVQTLPGRVPALVLASLVFGAAHLNNGPAPDLRFAALATAAGLAYGVAFRARGSLIAPAIAHALVGTTWTLWFRE